jgi:RimJ/RimL family protein N-acetyltransferase
MSVAVRPYRDITIRGIGHTLRAWREDDVEAAFGIWGRPEVARWLLMDPTPDLETQSQRLADLIARYEAMGGGYGAFALVPDEVAEPVGATLLKPLGNSGMIEVGWHMNPQYWNRGYASAGAVTAMRYGFEDLGLGQIHAIVLPENAASNAVAAKVGLSDTGETYTSESGVELKLYRAESADWLSRATVGGRVL